MTNERANPTHPSRFRELESRIRRALTLAEAARAGIVRAEHPLAQRLVDVAHDLMEQLDCPDGAWSLRRGANGSPIFEGEPGSRFSYYVVISLTVLGRSIDMPMGFKQTDEGQYKFLLFGEPLGLDQTQPRVTEYVIKTAVDIVTRNAVQALQAK